MLGQERCVCVCRSLTTADQGSPPPNKDPGILSHTVVMDVSHLGDFRVL